MRGREIGVARRIKVEAEGQSHPLFRNKSSLFDAVSIHLDHVTKLPSEAVLLASNAMSEMQAIAMNIGTAEFWGVQYHPEFDLSYIAGVFRRYAEMMLNEGFVASPADLERLIGDYTRLQEVGDTGLAWRYGLGADVLDSCSRTQEIANWLEKISALDK